MISDPGSKWTWQPAASYVGVVGKPHRMGDWYELFGWLERIVDSRPKALAGGVELRVVSGFDPGTILIMPRGIFEQMMKSEWDDTAMQKFLSDGRVGLIRNIRTGPQ